jgi:hypothetical protein
VTDAAVLATQIRDPRLAGLAPIREGTLEPVRASGSAGASHEQARRETHYSPGFGTPPIDDTAERCCSPA